jgi:hypothetical protein
MDSKSLKSLNSVSKTMNTKSKDILKKKTISEQDQKINMWTKFFFTKYDDITSENNHSLKSEKFINSIGTANVYKIRQIMKLQDTFFNECLKIYELKTGFSFDYLLNITDEQVKKTEIELGIYGKTL